jgi:hypothetical protein
MKKLLISLLPLTALLAACAEGTHETAATSDPETAPKTVYAINYQPVLDWPTLPQGREYLGNMHGDIAVSSKGEAYVSVQAVDQKNQPIEDAMAGLQVYADDGKYLRNVPNAPADLHGFVIRQEGGDEFLYGVRLNGQSIVKMTLDGQTVLTIPASAIPEKFKVKNNEGNLALRLSGIDVAPNGDLYVTDGYASFFIHRFDSTGKYLASFGGAEAPYNFKTLHQIAIDTRFTPARIIACDRANMRVVHLSLDGELLGEVAKDLLTPADVAIHGDYAFIAELKGQVTALDKDGKVVSKFGTNEAGDGTRQTEPAKWRPGILNTPHGIAVSQAGNVFLSEFSLFGRVSRFDRD